MSIRFEHASGRADLGRRVQRRVVAGRLEARAPFGADVAVDESLRSSVDVAQMAAVDERVQDAPELMPLVRVGSKLGIVEERVQDAQVRVPELSRQMS